MLTVISITRLRSLRWMRRNLINTRWTSSSKMSILNPMRKLILQLYTTSVKTAKLCNNHITGKPRETWNLNHRLTSKLPSKSRDLKQEQRPETKSISACSINLLLLITILTKLLPVRARRDPIPKERIQDLCHTLMFKPRKEGSTMSLDL